MSIADTLLDAILRTAQAQGLGQSRLAQRAGLRAETISRAKRRGTIDLNSLHALSTAVGLDLRLVPQDQAQSTLPLRCEDQPAPSRSPLADPRWGLAWSNRGASDETLVHNALLNGNFELLLQAALAHGLDAVHQQWRTVAPSLPARARSEIDRKLRNIAQGFADAQA